MIFQGGTFLGVVCRLYAGQGSPLPQEPQNRPVALDGQEPPSLNQNVTSQMLPPNPLKASCETPCELWVSLLTRPASATSAPAQGEGGRRGERETSAPGASCRAPTSDRTVGTCPLQASRGRVPGSSPVSLLSRSSHPPPSTHPLPPTQPTPFCTAD